MVGRIPLPPNSATRIIGGKGMRILFDRWGGSAARAKSEALQPELTRSVGYPIASTA